MRNITFTFWLHQYNIKHFLKHVIGYDDISIFKSHVIGYDDIYNYV